MKIGILTRESRYVLWISILTALIIIFLGVFSDLYLGDETFHYRLASYILKTNFERPLYDPLALTNPVGKSYYVDPMLWHYLLAGFWKMTTGVSKIGAQVYQALWLIVLIISTYLLARELRDRKSGLYSAILVITMPFSVALSVILHTDIPIAAASTLGLFFLAKKRIFWAAILLAIMTYIKRNSFFIIPSFFVFSLYFVFSNNKHNLTATKLFSKWALLFLIPFLVLILPEVAYRYMALGTRSFWSGDVRRPDVMGFMPIQIDTLFERRLEVDLKAYRVNISPREDNSGIYLYYTQPQVKLFLLKNKSRFQMPPEPIYFQSMYDYSEKRPVKFYDESNMLLNPLVFLKYFGIAVIIAMCIYFLKSSFRKKDFLIWAIIIIYIPIYCFVFRRGLNVRYLSPIIGYLAVIGGIGLSNLRSKFIRNIIILICIIQFLGTAIFVFSNRRIPAGLKEAYADIKINTPGSARIMCSKNALSLYSDRRSIWLGIPSLLELGFLFWQADTKQMLNLFDRYGIDYIFVEKDKIYDDTKFRHTGGYPESFVDKARSWGIFDVTFENNDAVLFKIKR